MAKEIICKECGKLSEHDSHGLCKKCSSKYRMRKYREKHLDKINQKRKEDYHNNPEKYREYSRKWLRKNPNCPKEYYEKNKEKIAEKQLENYRKNPLYKEKSKIWRIRNIEKAKKQDKQYYEENKFKSEAKTKAGIYNKKHRIKKHYCKHCGILESKKIKLYMHHPDYSKPIEVITLCASCHVKLHNS